MTLIDLATKNGADLDYLIRLAVVRDTATMSDCPLEAADMLAELKMELLAGELPDPEYFLAL